MIAHISFMLLWQDYSLRCTMTGHQSIVACLTFASQNFRHILFPLMFQNGAVYGVKLSGIYKYSGTSWLHVMGTICIFTSAKPVGTVKPHIYKLIIENLLFFFTTLHRSDLSR
ncbi:hypothetical protein ACJX0J_015190 [Zea mays]